MRISLFALAMFATTGVAAAQTNLSIPLQNGTRDSVESMTYACGGEDTFSVQYVNSGPNSLAILPIDDETRIFVNVLSASGAKYASGAYVWWTKGDTAMLDNQMDEDSGRSCQGQDELASE